MQQVYKFKSRGGNVLNNRLYEEFLTNQKLSTLIIDNLHGHISYYL